MADVTKLLTGILLSLVRYLGILFFCYLLTAFTFSYLIRLMREAGMVKPNFRNEDIPSEAGLIFVVLLPLTVSLGMLLGIKSFTLVNSVLFLFVVIGMGFLGLLDDLIGDQLQKGFKGHFQALFKEGRLTTGAFKAFFGAIIALVFSAATMHLMHGGWKIWVLISSFLLVTLGANTINLFDLRPGRAAKIFLFGFALILAFSNDFEASIGLFIPILAILLYYFPHDLKARVMMGDIGSNLLGATLGVMISWMFSDFLKILAILIMIILQLAAEKYSFSKIIEKNRWLRYLDNLGQEKPQ